MDSLRCDPEYLVPSAHRSLRQPFCLPASRMIPRRSDSTAVWGPRGREVQDPRGAAGDEGRAGHGELAEYPFPSDPASARADLRLGRPRPVRPSMARSARARRAAAGCGPAGRIEHHGAKPGRPIGPFRIGVTVETPPRAERTGPAGPGQRARGTGPADDSAFSLQLSRGGSPTPYLPTSSLGLFTEGLFPQPMHAARGRLRGRQSA